MRRISALSDFIKLCKIFHLLETFFPNFPLHLSAFCFWTETHRVLSAHLLCGKPFSPCRFWAGGGPSPGDACVSGSSREHRTSSPWGPDISPCAGTCGHCVPLSCGCLFSLLGERMRDNERLRRWARGLWKCSLLNSVTRTQVILGRNLRVRENIKGRQKVHLQLLRLLDQGNPALWTSKMVRKCSG